MQQTIHKYLLPACAGVFTIQLPAQGTLLSCHVQANIPCLWVLRTASFSEKWVPIWFALYETGAVFPHETSAPARHTFVGTLLLDDGSYALHLFRLSDTEGHRYAK